MARTWVKCIVSKSSHAGKYQTSYIALDYGPYVWHTDSIIAMPFTIYLNIFGQKIFIDSASVHKKVESFCKFTNSYQHDTSYRNNNNNNNNYIHTLESNTKCCSIVFTGSNAIQ